MAKKISIVIINWNGEAEDTIECLSSLVDCPNNDNFSFYVVDNASMDNSVDNLLVWASENKVTHVVSNYADDISSSNVILNIIRCQENLGFCKGNNLGAKAAFDNGCDFVVVLNNDTTVRKDFCTSLQKSLEQDNGLNVYSPQICLYSNKKEVWWCGGEFSNILMPSYLSQGDSVVLSGDVMETDWVSGCATILSKEVYANIGLYREEYFIWCEEWDFSLTAKSNGISLKVLPSVMVFHKVGKSLGIISPLTFFYSMRNMLLLRKRFLSRGVYNVILFIYIPRKFIQSVLYSIKKKEVRFLLAFFDAITSRKIGGKWARQNG